MTRREHAARTAVRPAKRVGGRVCLGAFVCGDCTVHIEPHHLFWLPSADCPLPNGVGVVALNFAFDTVMECTVDKTRGELAFHVMVDVPGDAAPAYFAPCKYRDHPRARVRIRLHRAEEWEVFMRASRTLQRKARFRALGESPGGIAVATPARPNALDEAAAAVQSLHAERAEVVSQLRDKWRRVTRRVTELMLLVDTVASERAGSKGTVDAMRTVLAEGVEERAKLQRREAEQRREAQAEALRRLAKQAEWKRRQSETLAMIWHQSQGGGGSDLMDDSVPPEQLSQSSSVDS